MSDGPKRTCRYCPHCLWPVYKYTGGSKKHEAIECKTHGLLSRSKTLNGPTARAEMARRRMRGASA